MNYFNVHKLMPSGFVEGAIFHTIVFKKKELEVVANINTQFIQETRARLNLVMFKSLSPARCFFCPDLTDLNLVLNVSFTIGTCQGSTLLM